MKGKLTISRPTGIGTKIDYIEIQLEDESSGVLFLHARIGYADFTKALTGQGYIPCSFETRGLDLIGMKREHKTELIFVPDGPVRSRKNRGESAIREFEKDGWTGRVEDADNFHKRKSVENAGAWYEVTFTRHV